MKLNKKIIAPLSVLLVAPALLLACSGTNGNGEEKEPEPKVITREEAVEWGNLKAASKASKTLSQVDIEWCFDSSGDWSSIASSNSLSTLISSGTGTNGYYFFPSSSQKSGTRNCTSPFSFSSYDFANGNEISSGYQDATVPVTTNTFALSVDETELIVSRKIISGASGYIESKFIIDNDLYAKRWEVTANDWYMATPDQTLSGDFSANFTFSLA